MRLTKLGLVRCIVWLILALPSQASTVPLHIVTFNHPPYIYQQLSRPPTGVAAEIVETALARMQTPVTFEYVPFRRALAYLQHGKADAIFTIRKTPERELSYHFSPLPLLTQDIVVFVRSDSPIHFTGDLQELFGYAIGVVNKISYGLEFDQLRAAQQFATLELSTSDEMNFKKLLGKRMDLLLCSRKVGLALLQQMSSSDKVKVIGPPIGSYKSYIAFSKKTVSPERLAEFDRAMMSMERDGTLRKLHQKHGM